MILWTLSERLKLREALHRLYRVEVRGAEHVPESGRCILVANHESLLDPWFLCLATQRRVRFMAKAELWGYPGVRWAMEAYGTFPIERGSGDTGAMGRAGALLEQDELLGMFPQGTALPYRQRRWHRGAARLALAHGAAVVPVCLVDTEKALRPHKPKVGRPRVSVIAGRAIEVAKQRPTIGTAKELTDRIQAAIDELRAPFGPPAHAWID